MRRQLTLEDHGGHRGTCFHIPVESRSLPEARPKVPYEPPSFAPLCASRAVVRIHPLYTLNGAFRGNFNSSTALLLIGENGSVSRGFRGPFTERNRSGAESRQLVRSQFIRRKVSVSNHTPLA